jgi:aminoglycoside phosphotransferase (APT) family kinase protein
MSPPGGSAPLDEAVVLSPEWLTAVLQQRHPEAVVTGTSVTERLETVATKVRFRVHYEAPVDGAPTALCAKGYFNPAMRGRTAGTQTETVFYRDLAAEAPVQVPPCVHAAIDDDTGHGLVLMSDLVEEGATFLDPVSTYDAGRAAATLEQLARFHAAHWELPDPSLATAFPPRLETLVGYIPTETLQEQLDDGRAAAVPAAARDAGRVQDALRALTKLDGPRCLVHGDVHTGNIYELADGSPGIIDWQLVQCGSWAFDVGYHVAAVLDPAERERSERALLEHYLGALAAAGVTPPAWDDAWWAYRAHLPYGFFLWGITRAVARPVVEHLTGRLGEAVAQHRCLDLLGV